MIIYRNGRIILWVYAIFYLLSLAFVKEKFLSLPQVYSSSSNIFRHALHSFLFMYLLFVYTETERVVLDPFPLVLCVILVSLSLSL